MISTYAVATFWCFTHYLVMLAQAYMQLASDDR